MKKKLPRNQPRDIDPERAWYYVNDGSVDLVLREPNIATITHRLKRRVLEAMLSELKPRGATR